MWKIKVYKKEAIQPHIYEVPILLLPSKGLLKATDDCLGGLWKLDHVVDMNVNKVSTSSSLTNCQQEPQSNCLEKPSLVFYRWSCGFLTAFLLYVYCTRRSLYYGRRNKRVLFLLVAIGFAIGYFLLSSI